MEDQLVAAYDRGLLVPFIGAGMSVPVYPLWGEFVTRLEQQAHIVSAAESRDLVQRAARAAHRLRHATGHHLANAVRKALSSALCGRPVAPTDGHVWQDAARQSGRGRRDRVQEGQSVAVPFR
jgi:hypothetical protein